MSAFLPRAIAAIEPLPPEVQEAMATRVLAEATDEQAWAAQCGATTDAPWDCMAEMVRRASNEGGTTPRDDGWPPHPP